MAETFTVRTFQDAAGISADLAAKWHAPLVAAMPLAEINTAERIAMCIAQCGHESGGFRSVEESLNYTPEALKATFNKGSIRFTDFDAYRYGRKPGLPADQRMIGILAYSGRLGNAPAPSDDGYNYRGRGLIQITGKDNYRAFGVWFGMPEIFEQNPGLVAKPEHAAKSAAWYWQANGLNKWADVGDVLTCSRAINLGSATSKGTPNGLADRQERYKRAIAVMRGRA
jgi:putative chitinase